MAAIKLEALASNIDMYIKNKMQLSLPDVFETKY